METGRRVAGHGGKLCASRIVNLPPLWVPRRSAFREACLPSVALPAFLQRFCKKSVLPVRAFVCITTYNANECVFFLQVLLHFVSRAEILPVLLPFAGGWLCLPRGAGGTRRRCRSPSVRCSARNIGRRATLLPSPRRRSFLPVSASRWWSPSFSVVLLLCVSCWGLWRSFLFRWGGYIRGYILSLFNRARNKRARTRKGWRCSFLFLCPLWGC